MGVVVQLTPGGEPRPFLVFEIPFLPISKKNRTHIRKRGARRWVAPTAKVETQQAAIAALAIEALARRKIPMRPLAGRDVGIRITWLVVRGMARVELFDRGPLVKIPGHRRDLGNMLCLVMDALTDVAYADDHQAHEIDLRIDHTR